MVRELIERLQKAQQMPGHRHAPPGGDLAPWDLFQVVLTRRERNLLVEILQHQTWVV